jgi:hypothetical protein
VGRLARAGADGMLHVAPCKGEGDDRMVGGHVLRADCFCKPKFDEEHPNLLIHNDPERGGFNA